MLLIAIIGCNISIVAQSFSEDKIAFGNFLKRMYLANPFEGVKIVDDYNKKYFTSFVSVE
jgi:hypothetical protein